MERAALALACVAREQERLGAPERVAAAVRSQAHGLREAVVASDRKRESIPQ